MRLLFDNVQAAPAVLTFLRDTRVGRIVLEALRRRTEGERGGEVDREGEGARPTLNCTFSSFLLSFVDFRGEGVISFSFFLFPSVLPFLFSFFSVLESRRPYFG